MVEAGKFDLGGRAKRIDALKYKINIKDEMSDADLVIKRL
jgi:hypothetical protein